MKARGRGRTRIPEASASSLEFCMNGLGEVPCVGGDRSSCGFSTGCVWAGGQDGCLENVLKYCTSCHYRQCVCAKMLLK